MDSPAQIPRHALTDGGHVGDVDDTLDGVAIGLRARWLLDVMPGLVGLLSPHGAVLELNGGALAAAGLTRSQAAHRKLWELDGWYRSAGGRRRAHRAIVRALARNAPTHLEVSLGPMEREPRTFDIVLTPIHDHRGQITFLVLEGRDVSDLRTAEAATIRDNAELHELADKLGEVDATRRRFITDVGHEFKTPLSIAVGLLDRALNDWVLPAPAQRDILGARRHTQSLQVLVDQLLTAARIEAGRVELVRVPCDLADLTRRVGAEFEAVAAAQSVTLEIETPRTVVVVADPERLASAITNVLSNALKVTPHDGRVRVELRERRRKALLEVSDTGPGVPARLREAIFERFCQGGGQRAGGSGIGLALVNEIVALHGGSVSVGEAAAGGAVLRLELPLAPSGATVAPLPDIGAAPRLSCQRLRAQLSRGRPAAGELAADADARPRVLLVEDHADLGMRLAKRLSPRFAVRHVDSAERALRELERSPHDLVVTDIVLPGRSGEALVAMLRSRPECDDMPIIAMSGGTDPRLCERLLRAGAQDFVSKPLNERELVARIDGMIARRAQEQTARDAAALAEASIQQAALGVGMLEIGGRWLRANRALCAMLGYSEQELRQMTLDELTAPEDVGIERRHLQAALDRQTRGFQVEKRLRRADGAYIWVLLSIAAIFRSGRPTRLVVHAHDAGERRADADALRHMEAFDELTGFLRRREFERRLGRKLRHPRGAGALLLVDIDKFRSVNHRAGRLAGDRVLRAVAKAIRAAAPNDALIGRITGDSFGVFVMRTSLDEAEALAAALTAAVAACAVTAGRSAVRVSARVGAVMLSPGATVDTALAGAEDALGEARRGGGMHVRAPRPSQRGTFLRDG
jgi:diguanylate cyclase (GGDEF)-like protein/PAS domain S-box-containing protein